MTSKQKFGTGLARSPWVWGGSLLALGWFFAIRQLQLEWTFNPQYQYGWIVPLLTLLLWWRAWPGRPPPDGPLIPSAVWTGLLILLAMIAVPVRIIQEANPDWRLLNDYFAVQAILLTSFIVERMGGKAWLRYFSFPLLFPLVAVPWPSGFEHDVIQGLQRVIAAIGVEASSWMGWSAYQSGNLIVLTRGIVGVNEACSGIRSLQSCLMIALFLGDYFQLANWKRVALLVLGLVLAFGFNAVRAFFLIAMMEAHGEAGLSKYHDPAGFGIALGTLLLLWIVASYTAPRQPSHVGRPVVNRQAYSIPMGAAAILLGAWIAAELSNQGWYRWHEQNSKAGPVWSLQWPLPRPDFKTEQIDETVRTILRFDEGLHGKWRDQNYWEAFFFKWNPSHVASGLAEFHQPDICLPAAGFVMQDDLGIKKIDVRGLTLPVGRYVFQDPFSGRLFYVFQIVTDDRVWTESSESSATGARYRLTAAWHGRRNPGQRSLLVVNQGAENIQAAEEGLRRLLDDALITNTRPVASP